MSEQVQQRRNIVGVVVGKNSAKTVKVSIQRLVQHPVYKKYLRRTTSLLVHDEQDICELGDKVAISQCRPVSKRKSWTVVEVIK